MRYWAKTSSDGTPGISVLEHTYDVGTVARSIAEIYSETLARFHLQGSQVGALAALHDIGKISPGFQRKCDVWLQENGLTKISRNGCWDNEMESDHGKVTHAFLQGFLQGKGYRRKTAKQIAS